MGRNTRKTNRVAKSLQAVEGDVKYTSVHRSCEKGKFYTVLLHIHSVKAILSVLAVNANASRMGHGMVRPLDNDARIPYPVASVTVNVIYQ